MDKEVYVIKANGERELFDIEKLKFSLQRAGVSFKLIQEISQKIEGVLVDGMRTKDIYKKAFSYLIKNEEKISAAKYSVRRAILDLGPNGFPFEDFIGEIFRMKKFKVEVGKTLNGFCVRHELDVLSSNDEEMYIIEIKFHNNVGIKSDLKTALYVKARFDDLEKGGFFDKYEGKIKNKTFLTNTKFTSRALKYGTCAGLKMIGWNYPEKGNLQDLIEETGLHPLTCLTSLKKKEKKDLLNRGIVLCRDLKASDGNILETLNIPKERVENILSEIKTLCKL